MQLKTKTRSFESVNNGVPLKARKLKMMALALHTLHCHLSHHCVVINVEKFEKARLRT